MVSYSTLAFHCETQRKSTALPSKLPSNQKSQFLCFFYFDIAQLKGGAYICNQMVAKNEKTAHRDPFHAIADPTRRRLLQLLAAETQTPNQLAEAIPNYSRQAISKHLQILVDCGLLSLEVKGRKHQYSVNPGPMAEVYQWLEKIKELWESRFEQLDSVLENLKKDKL